MQHGLERFLKRKRGDGDHAPTAQPRPAAAALCSQRPSSKLVQVLNSQLVRRDPPDCAQPGPASQAKSAEADHGASRGQTAIGTALAQGGAGPLRGAQEAVAGNSTTGRAAAAHNHQPQEHQQEHLQRTGSGGGSAQRCLESGPPAAGPAAGNAVAAETRPCPLCGQRWPLDGFQEHLQQELAALEEEEEEGNASGCAAMPAAQDASGAWLPCQHVPPAATQHAPDPGHCPPQHQQQHRVHSQHGNSAATQQEQRQQCGQLPGNPIRPPLADHKQAGAATRPLPRHLFPSRAASGSQAATKKQKVLVLGGRPQATATTDPRTLEWRQLQRQQRRRLAQERQTPIFNHYADGSGFWDGEDIGIDGAEHAGLAWEGMGTTSNL